MPNTHHKTPAPRMRETARRLRAAAPIPERVLWGLLRGKKLAGLKFRRQHPIEPFVVDYGCVAKHLVVELDGETHAGSGIKDEARTACLERLGWHVLRITVDELLQHEEAVVIEILQAVRGRQESLGAPSLPRTKDVYQERRGGQESLGAPSPQPSPGGRGGRT